MKSGIYRIRNTRNGKFYVGSAKDFKKREKEHLKMLRVGKHHCTHLQNAYDAEPDKTVFAFEYPLLACCDDKKILEMYEQQFIDFYKDSGRLYNASLLANRPDMTPEVCAKIGKALEGNNHGKGNKGKKRSLEAIEKMSNARKGISPGSPSEQTRLKLSKAKIGKRHTAEAIAKMSEAKKGKPAWNKGKKTGIIPWNKGKPHPCSAETAAKLRAAWAAKRATQKAS